jgi:Glycine-rich domain-containing protein-like
MFSIELVGAVCCFLWIHAHYKTNFVAHARFYVKEHLWRKWRKCFGPSLISLTTLKTRWRFCTQSHDITRTFSSFLRFPKLFILLADRFLDLLASTRSTFYVPTLDIDLAWHTHQLMGQKYNNQCRTFVKRFIDQSVLIPFSFRKV